MNLNDLVTDAKIIGSHNRIRNLVSIMSAQLERDIDSGKFKPGERLPTELEMIKQYKVSRTVVREAIAKLQYSQRVVTKHGLGTFVTQTERQSLASPLTKQALTVQDTVNVLELRMCVESEAASMAAKRRSPDNLREMKRMLDEFEHAIHCDTNAVTSDFSFHLEVIKSTANPYFYNVLNFLGSMVIPRSRLEGLKQYSTDRQAYLAMIHAEHFEIYTAIKDRDSARAHASTLKHLNNSRNRLALTTPLEHAL
jgi:GntR family transcriptional regulator, transcriptional repressor for pyruvate dehydrogenase complex